MISYILQVIEPSSYHPSAGVGNVRPAGHIRPAETFHPAREHILRFSRIII